jgi:hypothetical protein
MPFSDSTSGVLRRMRDVQGDMSGLCEACGHTDCQRVTEVQVGDDDYMVVCPACMEIAALKAGVS